ncbi:MAG: sulfatase [Akkermansiaceae bacterium]
MKNFLSIFIGACILLSQGLTAKPNIVFILADDLGIMDIVAFATHFTDTPAADLYYETPNLDKLAREGVSFSQSYANQLCSPTRAAVMTGRVASTLGFTTATPNTKTYYNQGRETPDGCSPHDAYDHKDAIKFPMAWLNGHSNTGLDPKLPTLPKVLKTHDSYFIGKWHLGGHGADHLQPAAHGFHEIASLDAGASAYFNWQRAWNNRKPAFVTMPGKFRAGTAGKPPHQRYLVDDLAERISQFLKDHSKKKKTNPAAKPFFLYYCPFAVHTPFQAPETTVDYFTTKKTRGTLGHKHPTYAAMLKHLDASIGKIRQTLHETGLAEDTLIIFTSDNGGVKYTQPAATDNQPFVGGKATLYEGGIRVPTIAYWPGKTAAGKWCDQVIDCTDFLPTLAQVSGNEIPKGVDGISMLDLALKPDKTRPERTLYWHYPFNVIVKHPLRGTPLSPHSAIRVGPHKLIWDWHGKLELYHIPNDPHEKTDLSTKHPELTKKLHIQLKQWLRTNVSNCCFPRKNPDFDKSDKRLTLPFTDLSP